MIYCENIMDMKPVFYSSRDFETTFFFPFLTIPLSQLLKKKNFILLFQQWHCRYCLFFFNFNSTQLPKFNIFYLLLFGYSLSSLLLFVILSPLSYFLVILSPLSSSLLLSSWISVSLFSLLLFWLNFGNAIAEIQSLSSVSQLTSNSSYNAN